MNITFFSVSAIMLLTYRNTLLY